MFRVVEPIKKGISPIFWKMSYHKVLILTAIIATVTAGSPPGRIVGGEKAKPGEFPYVVSLQYYSQHFCGGSILNEKYILTAANCVTKISSSDIKVHYGIGNLENHSNRVGVKKMFFKDKFISGHGYHNDIAILELRKELKFGQYVQPVKLPDADSDPGENAKAVIVGWGTTEYERQPQFLKKVNITIFTHEYCEERKNNYSPEHHFCAGGHGLGICLGDSGGPLTVNGVQYGIASWTTEPCGVSPGVFANVVSYRDWIKEKTGL